MPQEEKKRCLDRLFTLFDNKSELARQLSIQMNRQVPRQEVNRWKVSGIPAGYAAAIERLTGGHITAREILEEKEVDKELS